MTKHLPFFALVLGLALPTFATTGLFTNIHHQYQSTRAMGMGDAFTAVANDPSALFYNPAAYARFTEGNVILAPIDASVSTGGPGFYNQVQGLSGSGPSNVSNIVSTLSSLYGSQYGARVKILEADWARPGWGMALVPADVTLDLAVNNQVAPAVDLRAYGDTTLAFGFGKSIKNDTLGLLSWGATIKGIQREYVSTEVNALDLAASSTALNNALSSGNLSSGFTADVDLGLLFTPYLSETAPEWFRSTRPTFAFVGRNLVDSGFGTQFFKLSGQNGTPEQLYRVFDVGSKFEIPKFWIFGGRFALDERDIGHPQFNWRRGSHAGLEFDWSVASWWKGQWRAGYGEGYWSAGFSALFAVFRLDLATYAEDVGTYAAPVQNRMFEVKIAADL